MDIDFKPPATNKTMDAGIRLSTINKTVDAKGELLVERTCKTLRLGIPVHSTGSDKSSRLRTNRYGVQAMRAIGNP